MTSSETSSDFAARYDRPLQRIELPQLSLAYREWNPGGEPVLLLHGLADYGGVWVNFADALGDRFHCVAPDLRGHGDSGKPLEDYSCDAVIADLAALVQHLGWERMHIVAHSWAAKVAVVWAQQQPQRVSSLVLADPFFIDRFPSWMGYTFPLLYRVLPFLKLLGPFTDYAAAATVGRQLKQYRGWSEFQAWVFQGAVEQKSNGQWGSKFAVAARDGVFDDTLRVKGLTQTIDLPTLFVRPEQGLNKSQWQMKPYQQYFTNLQMCSVPGNHWCFLVEPEAFNQAVTAFLDIE
ncbi:alpha/beta hydrolase [filamentous cyanobacterium LEGE 11480]|uniref:Alpha/beta hydrolase n=1 Tax=Romeriopsis navalis LEGE 11480 TaxID=2777977 RepID=A0A928Z4T0_9CYAN|nr:alpha/beta hydrolase [Romeriopsis navalis]MBE9032074.1 alpha/beta hydrolase [Romeriopsis navalis LEGE 11480]